MTQPAEAWLQRNHFLLRRLHSLSGIVPVGVFLVIHLYTNSLVAWDSASYDTHVKDIHHIPFLPVVELLFIFLPLAFHAGYGIVIAKTGKSNVQHYGYADNWRYTLQRVSGWVALVFILIHLAHYRFAHWFGGSHYQDVIAAGTTPFDITAIGFSLGLPKTVWLLLYSAGLIASIFHFCNGICTFCITWGITVNDSSRKKVTVASAGLALLLTVWGFSSLAVLAGGPKTAPKAAAAAESAIVRAGEN